NIMHEEYMYNNANLDKFKRHARYNYMPINVGTSLLFNMHYMNQKYHIKFNKIIVVNQVNYNNEACYNFTIEVENTNNIYRYNLVERSDLSTITHEFDNIIRIDPW